MVKGAPDATLAISIVLALPVVGALERCVPEQVVDLTRTLLNRFGAGDARKLGSVYAVTTQPSKFDDHRED